MLYAGIVLLLIGAMVVYVGRDRSGPDTLYNAGAVVVLLGLVLIVVAVVRLLVADAEAHTMSVVMLGAVGMVATKPAIQLAGRPRPVLVGFIVAAVPVLSSFALQVLEQTDVLDSALWLRTLLNGLGAVVGLLAAAWTQARVTPLEDPLGADGIPLVPERRRVRR